MSETLVPVDIVGVGLAVATPQVQPTSPEMVLVLRESSGRRRWLPIAISPPEARAISDAQAATGGARSGMIGVVAAVLDALDRRISRVELTDVRDTDVVSELVLDNGRRVPVRPCDAVALALSAEPTTPMLVAEHVLSAAGTTSELCEPDEPADRDDDEQVDRFRAFLDTVSPQDFDDSQR